MDAGADQSQDHQSQAQADRGGHWPAVQCRLVAGAYGALPSRRPGPAEQAGARSCPTASALQGKKGGNRRASLNQHPFRQTLRFATMNSLKDQSEEKMSFSLWPWFAESSLEEGPGAGRARKLYQIGRASCRERV